MAVHHILSGDAGSTGDRFGLVYTGDNVSGDRIKGIGELENGGDGCGQGFRLRHH